MTFAEQLDQVVAQTGHERYRYLCLEHPDPQVRADYRAIVESKATGAPMPARPSVPRRIVSASKAVARFVLGGLRLTAAEVSESRLATCRACDRYDAGWCGVCGCLLEAKTRMPAESCPLGKWGAVQAGAECGGCGAKKAAAVQSGNSMSSPVLGSPPE